MPASIEDFLATLSVTHTQYITVADDKSAVMLLKHFRMHDKFQPNPHPPGKWLSVVVRPDHPSHFIAGVRIEGFASAQDNGYVAHFFPKKTFTDQQVKEFLAVYFSSHQPGTFSFSTIPLDGAYN